MTTPLLVGIDVGSSKVRSLVFDGRGRLVAGAAVPTPTETPRAGWTEYPAEPLWQAVKSTLGDALARIDAPVSGIAAASVGEAAFPLDEQGRPLHNAIAWFDPRTRPQALWLEDRIGPARIAAITGHPVNHTYGLCKLMWLREHAPRAYAATRTWLNIADWVAFQLSGIAATDYSLASRTLAMDLGTRRWSEELLGAVDVDPRLFAPLRPSGTRLGAVAPHVVAEVGDRLAGAAVGVGGHDHILGAMAVGAVQPGIMLDSLGTAELIFTTTTLSISVARTVELGPAFAQGAVAAPPDTDLSYVAGTVRDCGGAIEAFRAQHGAGVNHAHLIEEAEAAPPGSDGLRFLPWRNGEPEPAHRSGGRFVGDPSGGRGIAFRALLEGLAVEARIVHDRIEAIMGDSSIGEIRITGGGSQNMLLLRLKASAFARPLRVFRQREATSLGAALLGGIAAGSYHDLVEAQEAFDEETFVVEPELRWVAQLADLRKEVEALR